jgi:hypothetical protein
MTPLKAKKYPKVYSSGKLSQSTSDGIKMIALKKYHNEYARLHLSEMVFHGGELRNYWEIEQPPVEYYANELLLH